MQVLAMSMGMHADQVVVTASGAFHWSDGNIGGVGYDWAQTDTTLDWRVTWTGSFGIVPSRSPRARLAAKASRVR